MMKILSERLKAFLRAVMFMVFVRILTLSCPLKWAISDVISVTTATTVMLVH